MAATFDRVAERAATYQPAKILLTVLAVPFYVVGFVVGVLWVALAWAWAAVLVGVGDVRRRDGDG